MFLYNIIPCFPCFPTWRSCLEPVVLVSYAGSHGFLDDLFNRCSGWGCQRLGQGSLYRMFLGCRSCGHNLGLLNDLCKCMSFEYTDNIFYSIYEWYVIYVYNVYTYICYKYGTVQQSCITTCIFWHVGDSDFGELKSISCDVLSWLCHMLWSSERRNFVSCALWRVGNVFFVELVWVPFFPKTSPISSIKVQW